MRRLSKAHVMLLVTVCLWGFNFTVTKYVLTHGFKPLAYSSLRYGGAALLFSALTYRMEGTLSVRRRDLPLLLVAAGIGIWLNQITYMYAVKLTTATTVALILGSTPIFAALIARAAGLERLSRVFWVASLVSFVGVALVAVGSGGGVSGDVAGDVLPLGTAATWAAYSVIVAPLMRGYSPYQISAVVLFVGWVPLAATGAGQLVSQDWSGVGWLDWVCLAYALLGPLVLTNVVWFTAIDRVRPSRAALFANLQPFGAAIVARAPETILPFDLLRNSTVAASIVCVALVGMAMLGTIAYVPLFAQGVIGTSATSSGVVLTPFMLGAVTTSFVSGQLVSRIGRYRPNTILGPIVLGIAMLLLYRMGPGTTNGVAARNMVVAGIGLGMMMQMFVLSVQNSVPMRAMGSATALTQFSRSIGATLGVTLMGVIVNQGLPRAARGHEQLSHRLPPRLRVGLANALHPAFLAAAGACGLVLAASILWIREVPLRRGFEDVAVGDEASPHPGTRAAAR